MVPRAYRKWRLTLAYHRRPGQYLRENSLRYDLKTRYFQRLGLSEKWIRGLLETGAAEEIALVDTRACNIVREQVVKAEEDSLRAVSRWSLAKD